MPSDQLTALLKEKKLKVTMPRLAILKVLVAAHEPLSSKHIHHAARETEPMNRVTVYRNLEAFYRAGLLERVQAGEKAWLYHLIVRPDKDEHPHFYCRGCGALICLPPETLVLDMAKLRNSFPARVDHCHVKLEGLCPDCLNQR